MKHLPLTIAAVVANTSFIATARSKNSLLAFDLPEQLFVERNETILLDLLTERLAVELIFEE